MKELSALSFAIYFLFAGLSQICLGDEDSLPTTVKDAAISIQDIEGVEQFPFRIDDSKAAALIFVTHDCPISNAYAPELYRLKEEYGSEGFKMMLVYVDPDVTEKEIRKHREAYSLSGVLNSKGYSILAKTMIFFIMGHAEHLRQWISSLLNWCGPYNGCSSVGILPTAHLPDVNGIQLVLNANSLEHF